MVIFWHFDFTAHRLFEVMLWIVSCRISSMNFFGRKNRECAPRHCVAFQSWTGQGKSPQKLNSRSIPATHHLLIDSAVLTSNVKNKIKTLASSLLCVQFRAQNRMWNFNRKAIRASSALTPRSFRGRAFHSFFLFSRILLASRHDGHRFFVKWICNRCLWTSTQGNSLDGTMSAIIRMLKIAMPFGPIPFELIRQRSIRRCTLTSLILYSKFVVHSCLFIFAILFTLRLDGLIRECHLLLLGWRVKFDSFTFYCLQCGLGGLSSPQYGFGNWLSSWARWQEGLSGAVTLTTDSKATRTLISRRCWSHFQCISFYWCSNCSPAIICTPVVTFGCWCLCR